MVRYWLVFVIGLFTAQVLHAEERVAFVVGNSNYENTSQLSNSVQDARLITAVLEKVGFDVTTHQDLSRGGFARAFSKFLASASEADIAFFYFAGHGVQLDGTNYLLGTDATLKSEFDVISEGISLDDVTEILTKRTNAALIFVDACRDNPLADTFFAENFSQSRSIDTRGLAPVTSTNTGSMLVFAASPGQVAYDGIGSNSPFSLALARHLPTPGAEILSLMKRVISDVRLLTNGRQNPTVTNDLAQDIFLAGQATIFQDFESASANGGVEAWERFLEDYEGSGNSALITSAQRLRDAALGIGATAEQGGNESASTMGVALLNRELEAVVLEEESHMVPSEDVAFEAAKKVNTPRGWAHFFAAFPSGKWTEDALQIEARTYRGLMRTMASAQSAASIQSGMRTASVEFLGLTRAEKLVIQSNLESLGYQLGEVDGILGNRTYTAIKSFQSDRGLISDGIIDRPTLLGLDLPSRRANQANWFNIASPTGQRFDPEQLAHVEQDVRVLNLVSAFPGSYMTYGLFNGRLYAVVRTNAFGTAVGQALNLASDAGGNLVEINSPEENSFVIDLFRFDKFYWADGYNGANWQSGPTIGLIKDMGSSRGWQWVSGHPVTFSAWLPGYPVNQSSAKVAEFRIRVRSAELGADGWGWADHHDARGNLVFEIE